MKKNLAKLGVVAGLACAAALCLGGTLAGWSVTNSITNHISTVTIQGKIEEDYEQGQTIVPDQTVDKVVWVKNTGSGNVVARAKVLIAWDDDRVPANADEYIAPNYNTNDWTYNDRDGYWYYNNIIEPGQVSTQLFDSFKVSKNVTNEFANQRGHIGITMELLQASEDAIQVWSRSWSQYKRVPADLPAYTPKVSTVNFNFDLYGASINFEEDNLFLNFQNLYPGDIRSQTVDIRYAAAGNYDGEAQLWLSASLADNSRLGADTEARIWRLLKQYAYLTVTGPAGNTLYQGTVWGNLDSGFGSDTMRFAVPLGTFARQGTARLQLSLTLDKDTPEDLQGLIGYVQWNFLSNPIDEPDRPAPTPTPVPAAPSYGYIHFDHAAYSKKWPQTGDAVQESLQQDGSYCRRYTLTTVTPEQPQPTAASHWYKGRQYKYNAAAVELLHAPEPITETKVYSGLKDKAELPGEITVKRDGEEILLTLREVQWTEELQASAPLTGTVDLGYATSQPAAAAATELTAEDGTAIEAVLVGIDQTEEYAWRPCTVYGYFVGGPHVQGFYLGETLVPYQSAAPTWEGYENAVLAYLGLSSESNRITGAAWQDDWHDVQGETVRTAAFTLESYSARFTARYAQTDAGQIPVYSAAATYAAAPVTEEYIWQITEYYLPGMWSIAKIAGASLIGTGLLIFAAVMTLHIVGGRKKQTQKETAQKQ